MLKRTTCVAGTVALVCIGSARGQDPDFPEACAAGDDGIVAMAAPDRAWSSDANSIVLNEIEMSLPNLAGDLISYRLSKELDRRTNVVTWSVASDGVKIDDFEQRRADARAWALRTYGRMDPALFKLLEDRGADEAWRVAEPTVSVLIRVNGLQHGRHPKPRRLSLEARRALVSRVVGELEDMERDAALVVTRAIGDGWSVREGMSQHGPFIRASLSDDEIRLAKDNERFFFWYHEPHSIPDARLADGEFQAPSVPDSLTLTRTNLVQDLWQDDVDRGRGRGEGVRIGILESWDVSHKSRLAVRDRMVTSSGYWHLTYGAALICDRIQEDPGTWVGFAPRAEIVLANKGTKDDYIERARWALDLVDPAPPVSEERRASVLSMSEHFPLEETSGQLQGRDVYFDYVVASPPWPNVVTSAGNKAPSDAYASGKGYNFFGVGDVVNNKPRQPRCFREMSCASSWRNPRQAISNDPSDREVPEIAAPGTSYRILDDKYHSSTSAATSVMAGIVATLIGINEDLGHWPEATRAILLAGANADVDNRSWNKNDDGSDGAGLVNTHYSALIAKQPWSGSASFRGFDVGVVRDTEFNDEGVLIDPADPIDPDLVIDPEGEFDPNDFNARTWLVTTCTTGCRIRVALAWNSTVTETASTLDADLDLYVLDLNEQLVEEQKSVSFHSSHEFIEFRPDQAGSYRIQIRNGRLKPGAEPTATPYETSFGVAWTAEYDGCP